MNTQKKIELASNKKLNTALSFETIVSAPIVTKGDKGDKGEQGAPGATANIKVLYEHVQKMNVFLQSIGYTEVMPDFDKLDA